MKNINRLVMTLALVSLGMTNFARAGEEKSEIVDLNSVPAAVQKTIKDKAAGGEIVQVKREDDKDGRWNYEATVKTDGKEWQMEIDPNGKFIRKHDHKK